jgi:hypothetical protein
VEVIECKYIVNNKEYITQEMIFDTKDIEKNQLIVPISGITKPEPGNPAE